MSDTPARRAQLDSLFGVELADRRHALNTLLLEFEQSSSEAALNAIRRELHSLKGAAQAVDARAVEDIAAAAESAALGVPGDRRPDTDWLDAMCAALEMLGVLQATPHADPAQVVAALVAVTPEVPVAEPPPATPGWHTAPLEPSAAAPTQPVPGPVQPGSIRVSLTKLDTLLTESGELSVTHLRISRRLTELRELTRQLERWQRESRKTRPLRSRLRRAQGHGGVRDGDALLRFAEGLDQEVLSILQRTRAIVGDLAQNTAQLGAVATAIGQEVLAIRLLPVGTVFMPLERLVRDLCRQTGKDTRLALTGANTEIDRRILDELRDPLMHMVRNTVDHGLEAPADRLLAGKPAQGTLQLSAVQRGGRVQISVEDDGRGLDVDAIRATAIRRNVLTAERAAQLDTPSLIDLIFQPGFSTRTTVSELSGRGVGMDVVREHVTRLGGEIVVRTTPGQGTCFTITVPLTLATTRVLLVESRGQTFAVPSTSIERTGRVRAIDMQLLEGRRAVRIDGRAVPVVELADLLQRPDPEASVHPSDEWRPFFILPHGDRPVAILADRLVDETELVVKPLGAPLTRVRHVGGAAVLGTGAVVVILNPGDLVKSALGNLESCPRLRAQADIAPVVEQVRRRVLVVDDSVMTRTIECTILESGGYSVVVASDGQHALEVLCETHVDAIVSDIEMPRMNGLELTSAIRQDERWRHLPIVLVTSLDVPEHIEHGAAVGADAYIVKGRFKQDDLLIAIGRLL